MVPHLIMVAKVVYPHMFLHVGVIEILPEPAHITPVEVPLSITVEEKKKASNHSNHTYDDREADDVTMTRQQTTLLTPSLQPSLVFGAGRPVWC